MNCSAGNKVAIVICGAFLARDRPLNFAVLVWRIRETANGCER